MRKFTKKEDNFLRDNYKEIPAKQMSRMLNRSENSARQRMALLGLVVPKEITEKFKQQSQYKKGTTPKNKGKKWSDFMSKKGMANSKKTTFKKGNLPHTTLFDGCITVRTDQRGIKYKFIRVAKAKWVPLQRRVWEQKKGKIPKGCKIIFKDKNPMNCNIGNLKMVTCKELMLLNSVHNLPKPLALAVQLRGALNRQINKHKKRITA